jgi:hypothetical protein
MRSRFAMLTALTTALLGAAACGSNSSGPTGPSGPPIVTDVNGATLPAGPIGSSVIAGSDFGNAEGSSQVLFSNGSGGTVPAIIASAGDWSDKFIVTTVPNGAATGDVIVQTSKGTSSPLTFTIVSGAVFSPSTISWTATSALPLGRSGLAAAFAELPGASVTRVVYAAGGAGTTQAPASTVYYSTVGASGALGAWVTTSALPAARAFSGAVVATPGNSRVKGAAFLYVLGGATDSLGTPTTIVYRGSLAANGTVTAWTTDRSLPIPLHSMGAALFDGDLYLFGGSTTGNVPVKVSYRARIDSLGAIGPWTSQAPLPYKASYFGHGQFGRFLYVFGGDTATATPSDSVESSVTAVDRVLYAGIDLHTGNIDAAGWTEAASSLKKATRKHSAVVAGGNVLITGGLYNGAKNGATEESYAQLNADGSTASVNGATGSNTIQTLGGGNLFNQSTLGYSDGNGAFHVLVLAGDDVNTPGTKHVGVYYY